MNLLCVIEVLYTAPAFFLTLLHMLAQLNKFVEWNNMHRRTRAPLINTATLHLWIQYTQGWHWQEQAKYMSAYEKKKWWYSLTLQCTDTAEQNVWQLHTTQGGRLTCLELCWGTVTAVLWTNCTPKKKATEMPSNNECGDMRYDLIVHLAESQKKQTWWRMCHAKCPTWCRKCDIGIQVKWFVIHHRK